MTLRLFHPSLSRPLSHYAQYRLTSLHSVRLYSSQPSPPLPPSPKRFPKHLQQLQSHLQALHRSTLKPRLEHAQADLGVRVRRLITIAAQHATVLGLKLNEVTGYQEVERLKALVTEQEIVLDTARKTAREAKSMYDQAVANRSSAQREVNLLLERKHSWTDSDVSAFTTLVRTDHASTLAVTTTSTALKECELAVDKAFSDLTSAILQRYHEEQVWSDKIRSVATWANVAGFLFNFFIFVIAIAIVEPWKRKRLVERVEERMTNLIARVETQVGDISQRLETSKSVSTETMAQPISPHQLTASTVSCEEPLSPALVLSPPRMSSPIASSRPYLAAVTSHVLRTLGYPDLELTATQTEVVAGFAGATVGIILCALVNSVCK